MEYKLRISCDQNRLTHLTTQMNYRLREGNGTAYYLIGVEDSGYPLGIQYIDLMSSFQNLCYMA